MRDRILFKKRKDFLEMIFEMYPEIKDSEYIRPIQNKIREYRDSHKELSEDVRQLAHMFIVQNKYFKEIYPGRYIA